MISFFMERDTLPLGAILVGAAIFFRFLLLINCKLKKLSWFAKSIVCSFKNEGIVKQKAIWRTDGQADMFKGNLLLFLDLKKREIIIGKNFTPFLGNMF